MVVQDTEEIEVFEQHLMELMAESIESTETHVTIHYWPSVSELSYYGEPVLASPTPALGIAAEHFRIEVMSRLEEFRKDLARIESMVAELQELDQRRGLGAIHSLAEGRVMFTSPLIYSCRSVGDEVMVSVGELGIHGVGFTETEALREATDDLWLLFQELERAPPEELSSELAGMLRFLRSRIGSNAMDA